MKAAVGDRVTVPGRHVGDALRRGEVVEVRGSSEAQLFVVKWSDGHEGVCSPGPEVRVERVAE